MCPPGSVNPASAWKSFTASLVSTSPQPHSIFLRRTGLTLLALVTTAHLVFTLTAAKSGWGSIQETAELGAPRWFIGAFFLLLEALAVVSVVGLLFSRKPLSERLTHFERTGVFIAAVGAGALAASAGLAGVNSLGVSLETRPTDAWQQSQLLDHQLLTFIVELAMVSILLSGSALVARLARELWALCERFTEPRQRPSTHTS